MLRVCGFLGDVGEAQAVFDSLPPLVRRVIEKGVDASGRPFETIMRAETGIAASDDHLFDPPAYSGGNVEEKKADGVGFEPTDQSKPT